MRNILSNKYLQQTLKFVLGLVFIIAGIQKIIDPNAFADSIANYRVFPIFTINFFAITVPWIELVSGILLIFNKHVKENSLLLGSLLLIFIVLVFSALIRGLDFECGCFGTNDATRVGWMKIFENIGLLFIAVIIFFFGKLKND